MPASTKVATGRRARGAPRRSGPRRRHRRQGDRAHRAPLRSTWRSPATWWTPTAGCSSPAGRSRSARGPAPGRTAAAATRSSARPCARPSSAGCARSSGLHVVRAVRGAARLRLPGRDARRHRRARAVPRRDRRGHRPDRRPTRTRSTTSCGCRGPTSSSGATREPWSLSPWSVEQVRQLAALGVEPLAWLDGLRGLAGRAAARPARRRGPPSTPAPVALERDAGALAVVHGPLASTLDGFLAEKAAETVALDPVLARDDRRDPLARRGRRQAAAARVRLLGPPGHWRRPRRRGAPARPPPSSSSTRSPCSTTT